MNNLDDIRKEYEELASLPADADGNAKRRRGFAFERLLNKLFLLDELEPRTGYRPSGEQIDGSIYLDGRIYLLEAKWHADPLPASTLYQFKGKVDGKLAGTIGFFISMSGYAEDAVDALILGKALNIILLDQRDIDSAIIRGSGFKNVLKLKLRKAAEEGAIFFPTEGELVTAEKARTVEIDLLRFDQTTGGVVATQPAEPATADLLIVCEGDSDRVVISTFAERILSAAGSGRSIKILTAMGKVTIPRVANAMWNTFHSESKVLIVVDGDNDPAGTAAMLGNGLEFGDWVAAIPNPSIETWLDLDVETLRRRGKSRIELSRTAAETLDIDALRLRDDQFAQFYAAILGE
ncbi:TOPRIM nucleotidyl transferase/hydrolase domain-containing protein [Burkholderia pseudomallei]|uniref:TOPRIM nucleotidyl transferase/hydrolase domain-containing protein n=1 Tax=Burkholderia pseudomallei TaxID=28450 RepID=UPI00048E870F|nr:TOPRIM nucleotidyl transferase/hydrolase domain-containing protein [Burkholderia pseudomallei]AJX96493.1 restriction endonuclease family protein [Burkholderia pseudomallei PB08298010]